MEGWWLAYRPLLGELSVSIEQGSGPHFGGRKENYCDAVKKCGFSSPFALNEDPCQ